MADRDNLGRFAIGHPWYPIPLEHELIRREKIRKSKKGKSMPWVIGKNNYNWNGGINRGFSKTIRESQPYKDWRSAVFERDLYTCRDCGKSGIYIEAHHIKNFIKYPELRFDIDNGLTLCKKCHHKKGRHIGIRGRI